MRLFVCLFVEVEGQSLKKHVFVSYFVVYIIVNIHRSSNRNVDQSGSRVDKIDQSDSRVDKIDQSG
jgi:hypothetical protein